MTLVYMIMGYCLPTITVMLLRDWWKYQRSVDRTEDS